MNRVYNINVAPENVCSIFRIMRSIFRANREVGISRGKPVRLYKVVLQLKSLFFCA